MLCKKCKTAIYEKTKPCGVCGANPPSGGLSRLVFSGLLTAVIIVACGGYIYMDTNGRLPTDEQNATEIAVNDPYNPKSPEPSTADVTGSEGSGTVLADGLPNEYQQSTTSQSGDPELSLNEDTSEYDGDEYSAIWTTLENIEYALSQFKYQNDIETNFISKNGFLFDYDRQNYIKLTDLIRNGFLANKYAEENVLLLYLKPSDFRGYKEVDFGFSSDLQLFSGCETKDGIALYSNGKKEIVYREHFTEILAHYKMPESEPYSPTSGSEEFNEISNAVIADDANGERIDVRYIKTDGIYAVVVFSYAGDPTVLHGYILTKSESGYKIVLRKYEQYAEYVEIINNDVSAFNCALLPETGLNTTTLYDKTKYARILDELLAKSYVHVDDLPVSYVCGTDQYVYIEFSGGKIFFGVHDTTDSSWHLDLHESRSSARAAFVSEQSGFPSWMIIKAD